MLEEFRTRIKPLNDELGKSLGIEVEIDPDYEAEQANDNYEVEYE